MTVTVTDSLAVRYRPNTLKDIIGQEYAKTIIVGDLKRNKIPKAILLIGDTGTGKTTFARIIATYLNCQKRDGDKICLSRKNKKDICPSCKYSLTGVNPDVLEINVGDSRGIDDARKLKDLAGHLPSFNHRIIILDECFAPATPVRTPKGSAPIKSIKIGDTVYNKEGLGEVINVFHTKVPLHRIVRLRFSDGSSTVCSQDHEYFVPSVGKVEAKNMLGYYAEKFEVNHGKNRNMSCLREGVCENSVEQENMQEMSETPQKDMRMVQGPIHRKNEKEILHPVMCGEMEHVKERMEGETKERFQKDCEENKQEPLSSQGRATSEMGGSEQSYVRSDENKQSYGRPRMCEEGDEDKETKGYFDSPKQSRRERSTDTRASEVDCSAIKVAHGGCCSSREEDGNKERLANPLQDRCSTHVSETGNRDRRVVSQSKEGFSKRQEKRIDSGFVRVEDITFYEQGCNDQHFQGIIGNRERSQGYCTFYDLEISGHHSYYANDHLVSNCQQLTPQAAQTLLKPIEEPPARTVWILASMTPEKLPEAIRNRCKIIPIESLTKEQVIKLMARTAEAEEYTIGDKLLVWLASISNSNPRDALNALDILFSIMAEREETEIDEIPQDIENLIIRSGIVGNEPKALIILTLLYARSPLVFAFLQKDVTDTLLLDLYKIQDSFVAHLAYGNKSWRWKAVLKLVSKAIKNEIKFNAFALPIKYHIALSALLGKAVPMSRQYGDPGIALRQVISEWFMLEIEKPE